MKISAFCAANNLGTWDTAAQDGAAWLAMAEDFATWVFFPQAVASSACVMSTWKGWWPTLWSDPRGYANYTQTLATAERWLGLVTGRAWEATREV